MSGYGTGSLNEKIARVRNEASKKHGWSSLDRGADGVLDFCAAHTEVRKRAVPA
jgi:hypothetical protein